MTFIPTLALAWLTATASAMESGAPDKRNTPVITVMKNQRMLVVAWKGDPDQVADKAMRKLYGVFFRNATEAEKNAPLAPRVRWTRSAADSRKRDWIGKYALPVSADFPDPAKVAAPNGSVPDGLARIEEWRYGLVAEILHVGPYAAEPSSLEILKDSIACNGFAIAGDFEEEYLQGRGTFYDGGPAGYRTLLRYPIGNTRDFPKPNVPLSSQP